jgi:lysyl-tRNA synthetase class 2
VFICVEKIFLMILIYKLIMSIPEFNEIIEQNDQTEARKNNLDKLRELVGNVYPNKFARTAISGKEDTITSLKSFEKINKIVEKLSDFEKNTDEFKQAKETINAELKELGTVRTSGRLTTPPRLMGKASFVHLSDGKNRIQIYVRRDDVKGVANDGKDSEINGWEIFQCLDHGDFVGVEGYLFLTNTGELSIHVEKLQFLSKAMLPMPDKMHGIEDAEIKQRRRYLDLIGSSLAVEHEGLTTREVFERRAKVIRSIRNFLEDDGYIEVETPMLSPKATGAAARPFATHHNALDIPLYARIAPELYLKRLTVGGFEKVYELNRNFRNEGISTRHNPEFTMLEFYCAYMDVNGMMDFCEELLQKAVLNATGNLKVTYGENEVDFGKFERITMKDSIVQNISKRSSDVQNIALDWKDIIPADYLTENALDDFEKLHRLVLFTYFEMIGDGPLSEWEDKPLSQEEIDRLTEQDYVNRLKLFWELSKEMPSDEIAKEHYILGAKNRFLWLLEGNPTKDSLTAKFIQILFEEFAEPNLKNPTFIIDYPKSISPLSKASPTNPNIAERFELFINGMECANGFSELNDPYEQYLRFADQMNEREKGDDEAMVLDEDYIRALSYGMPPAAGIGIGIDRLVMLLTNRQSIRDVILFPHMRPERRDSETLGQSDEEK